MTASATSLYLATEPSLNLVVGPPGAGKSTLCLAEFGPTGSISLDHLRELAAGYESDLDATDTALEVLLPLVRYRVTTKLAFAVDSTGLNPETRRRLVSLARGARMAARVVLVRTALEVCLERNLRRPLAAPGEKWDRRVPESVIREKWETTDRLARDPAVLEREGWDSIICVRGCSR